MTRIFNDEYFESGRYFEQDSRMNKLVGDKIRFVVGKLFHGTDINLDDFYFTVTDNTQPNAWFISKSNTLNNKNVIAVTRGLIEKASRLETFAAVIAHETGHDIWEDFISGNNSIIQERFADVNSVTLMIRAGWNPQYVTVMQKEIFGRSSNQEVSFDVHGSNNHRMLSTDDMLTYTANEKGYFEDIDLEAQDENWKKFQQEVRDIYAQDGYDTFIDKKLKQKFGTKDIKSINRIDVLRLFLDLFKTGYDMDSGARFHDLCDKLEQFDFTVKSDEETKVLQDIFLAIRKRKNDFNFFYGSNSKIYLERFDNMLGRFKLESFGPFEEQRENVTNLIKYYDDEEKAVFYAKKIKELSWTVNYKDRIKGLKFPAFKPLGAENVGKMLPWVKLKSYNRPEINEIYTLVCAERTYWGWCTYYSVIMYNENDYYVDENGIVIAYGDEARRLNELDKQKERLEKYNREKQANLENFQEKMDMFNKMIDYIERRISVIDFLKSIHVDFSYFDTDFVRDILYVSYSTHNMYPGCDVSEYADFYDKIKKSDFYNYFIKDSPDFALYPKINLHEYSDNPYVNILEHIAFLLYPGAISKFNNFVSRAILKIADDLTKTNEQRYQQWAAEIYKSFYYEQHGNTWHNTDFDKAVLESIGLSFWQIDDLIEQRKDETKKIEESKKKFAGNIKEHAVKNYFVTVKFDDYISYFIEKELSDKTESESIFEMMKSVGLTRFPQNEEDLIIAISYLDSLTTEEHIDHVGLRSAARNIMPNVGNGIISQEVMNQISMYTRMPRNNVTQLMYVLWAQYLKLGHKCNPINLIRYFEDRTNENTLEIVSDILSNGFSIESFKSLKLMEKFEIYEFMDTRKLFSEKYANKNVFIKIIIDELLKNEDKAFVVSTIEKILTRRGVTKYGKLEYSSDFEFSDEREKLIEYYSQHFADKLGRDDGSDEYLKHVKDVVDFITSVSGPRDERLFSSMIAERILNSVSDKVVSQERAAKLFGDGAKFRVNGDKVNDYDYFGRGAEAAINMLAKTPARALATIRFLNTKLTDDSVATLLAACESNKEGNFEKFINKQTLTIIHENFWGANLMLRSLVMERLLGAYSSNEDKKLNLVIDTYFKKDSPYYKDAVIVLNCVYKNLKYYERMLVLSALLSAGQNEDNSSISNGEQVGRGLKMFFQTKGGAFVKFGQLLSYLPALDSDIRKELATLRDRADIPNRDEIFEIMRESLPKSEFKKISYVGNVLGGGSIYITVHVKYDGRDCVIALMRPNTREKINGGLDVIEGTIDDMAAQDKKFEQLKNIVAQAKKSCASEIDIEQDHDKYVRAVKAYETLRVHTPTADYSPDVARWINFGCDSKKNNAYKIMEMAPGKSLTSTDWTEEEKHDMAMAYVALELSILLSGGYWDTDRHQGQQNFYNKSFRDFCIGIFDTGAQMDSAPEKADKVMLGHLFYELIRGARGGKSISDILNSRVHRMDSVGKFLKIDTSYIDGVQRGIIALSDIMEYQKEIKDEKGNIIQERKTLNEQDLQDIIVAVMNAGVVDKDIMKTVRAKAILNKLRVLRPGWFRTVGEGIKKMSSSISVEYSGRVPELSQIELLEKAISEIEELDAEKKSHQHLGIDEDLVVKTERVA